MSFLGKLFNQHIKNLGDAVTEKIVAFDPETATEAQIAELDDAFKKGSLQLAKAREELDRESKEAEAITALYDQRMKAAELLQTQANDPAVSAEKKTALDSSLMKMVSMLESMRSDVEREKREADDAKAYLNEMTAHVEEMALNLKSARATLDQAKRDMQRAEEEKKRAIERSDAAEVLAGIKKQGGQLNTALGVMRKRAEEAHLQAQAAEARTSLLKPTQHEQDDPNIAAAMSQASGAAPLTAMSLAERLAALKQK